MQKISLGTVLEDCGEFGGVDWAPALLSVPDESPTPLCLSRWGCTLESSVRQRPADTVSVNPGSVAGRDLLPQVTEPQEQWDRTMVWTRVKDNRRAAQRHTGSP